MVHTTPSHDDARHSPSVVVPGNHDGVHLGHRALVALGKQVAGARADGGLSLVALTFDPHPATVLAPERAPTPLTSIGRRVELLRGAGADHVAVASFDATFASFEPEHFVRATLIDGFGAKAVIVGPDYRFGRARRGDLALLRELGALHGFEVHVAEPVLVGGERVSSTRVRALLTAGEIATATELLARFHDVDGTVVHGAARGRTIGFPTANLAPEPVLLPKDGVYAVIARTIGATTGRADGPLLRGVANLGVRPTFAAGRSVEAHFFDFEGDLYDARLRVAFCARLRDELRFSGVDALKAQIAADAAKARTILSSMEKEIGSWC